MIALRNLGLDCCGIHFENLSFDVSDGEIYFLLNRTDRGGDLLFRVLKGEVKAASGEVLYDGRPPEAWGRTIPSVFVDRVENAADFETEARVGDWIDFVCAAGGVDRKNLFKTLLFCGFHERYLKSKVRDLEPELFQQVYLAAGLASERGNIVIHDFIRGAQKAFELKFNKLLLQKKNQGRALLCLDSDIFYASEIADRVGFVKEGRLLFEAEAIDLKEMDIKDLYLKFLN